MSGDKNFIPEYGWKVKLNHVFPERRDQNFFPKLKQIPPLLPLAFRYVRYMVSSYRHGRQPNMDYAKMLTGKQIYGAPVGGIGGGTIGRGFRGEFCRFHMRPGLYEYHTVPADQFIVSIQNCERDTVYQRVLSAHGKPRHGLSSWAWGFDGSDGQYCALYPRAWTVFDIPELSVRLVCRQVSPVIPHNYKDSCVPGAAFVWTVENNGDDKLSVSITMTFKNGTGSKEDRSGGCWSELFEREDAGVKVSGVQMHHSLNKMPYTYAIAAVHQEDVSVSRLTHFDPCGKGKEVWEPLLRGGELDSNPPPASHKTRNGEQLACAVCARLVVAGGTAGRATFSLVWDMPVVQFSGKKHSYLRYYTKWFPKDGTAAPGLSHYVLANHDRWESEIDAWQQPILRDPELPDWYKSALFNELYFIADGGSVWLLAEGLGPTDPRSEYGRFMYLEGHEYRMINTYDVHFYASFALAMLWPQLQLCLQRDFCDAVPREIATRRSHLYNGKVAFRKVKNSIPHDLGDPDEEPLELLNAYGIHDVADWRDLNLKFVLQCFRDQQLTGDEAHLRAVWPSARAVMERALEWDQDGDGLVENSGTPDQTYDSWVMRGPSAYCGGLWLAALFSMGKMADKVGETGVAARYRAILVKAKQALQEKLWNGSYYNFDCSGTSRSNTIMADQLCGHWYLRASGVSDQVFPAENVKSALDTIYTHNVLKFRNGTLGAVNGMRPDGRVDDITIQSEEVWVGVVYALAATMIHEGMLEQAFKTAGGVYHTVYHRIGLGFQTPEALFAEKHYRSIGYMRPLSIWAMQLAWEQRKRPAAS
ncbi:non-lysosomal glucosylceramidase isoform X3 [Bacillus rossius redtenbacheri]|uniref:non-lysosomal glucosylceramidase isoform X2 n=1 Tax=Bacillus rossius redtenbacheri TaxID=93214 RepID=UPI002FDE661F